MYYTIADCLLNKTEELEVIISISNPDIVTVTEVFPKNIKPSNIDPNEYKLKGYVPFINGTKDSFPGVIVYVKDCIPADYCNVLNNTEFVESVWIVLRLSSGNKLLFGAVYKSANSSCLPLSSKKYDLITNVSQMNYNKTVITGDFNHPDIDWSTWTTSKSENHVSFKFLEGVRDCYLYQHVLNSTRYRDEQNPSCLDLIFSDTEDIIENVKYGDKLGNSDHIGLILTSFVTPSRRKLTSLDQIL